MSKTKTSVYGELNPLYPTYDDKNVELDELMRFFKFSYQPSSGYSGTAVFEILDNDQKYILSIACDPDKGADTSRDIPPEKDISFHCTLPWDTFHDVFWGYAHPRVLVMGGGVKVKHWRYRAAWNFGTSFDMTSDAWVKYYKSGESIKKMLDDGSEESMEEEIVESINTPSVIEGIENVNARMNTQRIKLYDYKSIGATLPTNEEETEFMYEWKPSTSSHLEENRDIDMVKEGINAWNMFKSQLDDWRNKQRNIIQMNNTKHISLWRNLSIWNAKDINNNNSGNHLRDDDNDSHLSYSVQLKQYRENLTFNPFIIGKNLTEKWKNRIKQGSSKIVDDTVGEYYGWYSSYTRNRIGAISLSLMNNSYNKFTSLIYKTTTENETAHDNILNTIF